MEDWAEDVATLQIPAQWRSCLEDLSTLQLYTDYYFSAAPPLSNTALECLVRCASVRRSLFSSEETRLSFLSTLVNITLRVLQVCLPAGHHLCPYSCSAFVAVHVMSCVMVQRGGMPSAGPLLRRCSLRYLVELLHQQR